MKQKSLYYSIAVLSLLVAVGVSSFIEQNEDKVDRQIRALHQDLDAQERRLKDLDLDKLESDVDQAMEKLQLTE